MLRSRTRKTMRSTSAGQFFRHSTALLLCSAPESRDHILEELREISRNTDCGRNILLRVLLKLFNGLTQEWVITRSEKFTEATVSDAFL